MKWVKNRLGNFLQRTYRNYRKEEVTGEDIQKGLAVSNTAYLCGLGLIAWEGYNYVYSQDPISQGSILVILLSIWAGSYTREKALERSLVNDIDLEEAKKEDPE